MSKTICSESNCVSPGFARGYCAAHYGLLYRRGLLQLRLPDPSHHRLSEVDDVALTATCSICGPTTFLPRRGKRGRQCITKAKEPHRKAGPREKADPVSVRAWRYGLKPAQLLEMEADQNGRCAICGDSGELVIDHDHSCCATRTACGNCVRGLLCRRCNVGLGWFLDSVARLDLAAKYLRERRLS